MSDDIEGFGDLEAAAPTQAPEPAPKKRGRPRKQEAEPKVETATVVDDPIDPHAPPRYVMHVRTKTVTRWTPLFNSRVEQFRPFYRRNSDDREHHRTLVRKYETTRDILGGGGVLNAFGQSTIRA